MGALAEGESSDEECVRCQREKVNCMESNHATNASRRKEGMLLPCNYRRSDGTYESYAVRAYDLNDQGERKIREDYERYASRGTQNAPKDSGGYKKHIKDRSVGGDRKRANLKKKRPMPKVMRPGPSKRLKFGLSAYSEHGLPSPELELRGTCDEKYHESKKEELRSHAEKGTWAVVPLPKGLSRLPPDG